MRVRLAGVCATNPRHGRVSVAPLVDAVYPLADGVAALERASRPGTLKVLIETA